MSYWTPKQEAVFACGRAVRELEDVEKVLARAIIIATYARIPGAAMLGEREAAEARVKELTFAVQLAREEVVDAKKLLVQRQDEEMDALDAARARWDALPAWRQTLSSVFGHGRP